MLLTKFCPVEYKNSLHIPQDLTFHQHRCENVKCRFIRVKICLVVHKGMAGAVQTAVAGCLQSCIALLLAFLLSKMVWTVKIWPPRCLGDCAIQRYHSHPQNSVQYENSFLIFHHLLHTALSLYKENKSAATTTSRFCNRIRNESLISQCSLVTVPSQVHIVSSPISLP